MTNLHYLKFEFNEWLSGSIQYYDNDIKAFFIDLCAIIGKAGGTIQNDTKLHRYLRLDPTTVNERITILRDDDLIIDDNGVLSIKFITRQFLEYEKLCDQNRQNIQSRYNKSTSVVRSSTNKSKNKNKNKSKKENKKESKDARAKLLILIDPYKKRYPMPEDEYKKFIGYWLAVNDINEIPRFENDRYWKADTRLANWYGNWKKASTANGSPDLKIAKLKLPEGF